MTRADLIRAGVAALTQKGLSATGLEEILSAAGVPKGSFYHYFPSKEAFGLELIAAYAAYFAAKLDRHFHNAALSPLARLQAFFDDITAGMAHHGFLRGCLVGNLGQEMATLAPVYRQHLQAVFADWQERTAACLEAARAAGEIPPGQDCARLAAFFWIGWEGAVLRARLDGNATALTLFAQEFLRLLRAG